MKSWAEEFDGTWLADERVRARADRWVREWIARHRSKRGRDKEDVAVFGIERLAHDIRSFGHEGRWLWVTAAVCLVAELLFAARDGGVFRDQRVPHDRDAAVPFKALRILRNVTFHPAHSSPRAGSGEPHVLQLVQHLRENSEGDLADALAQSWAFVADRRMASFALRMVNSAPRQHQDTRRLFVKPR